MECQYWLFAVASEYECELDVEWRTGILHSLEVRFREHKFGEGLVLVTA